MIDLTEVVYDIFTDEPFLRKISINPSMIMLIKDISSDTSKWKTEIFFHGTSVLVAEDYQKVCSFIELHEES